MAALIETGEPVLRELNSIRAADLEPLLEEEISLWQRSLDWDFRPSANLVLRFVGMQALAGYALELNGEIAGYSYSVTEEAKGLVGDLYVRKQFQCPEYEDLLLEAVVSSIARAPRVRRVEAQLMLLPSSLDRPVPLAQYAHRHRRDFMVIAADQARQLAPGRLAEGIRIEPWTHKMQEPAAGLIAEAYRGHIDSQINDQYHSIAGARRFLLNIVQYPGCGSFFPAGSYLAIVDETGELTGLSLSSLVAADAGHITQICVAPGARRLGIGYEILRASLQGLVSHGCRLASLTVTAANTEAVQLYKRIGFRTYHSFAALTWEGFR